MSKSDTHALIITADGKVLSVGNNEQGQCGHMEESTLYKPKLIDKFTDINIVQVATGKKHSLFLSDNGIVYACGDNSFGQIGISDRLNIRTLRWPLRIGIYGRNIIKIGCGDYFSVCLDDDGNLFTFGQAEFGQLGK